jgi:hypothetical protein
VGRLRALVDAQQINATAQQRCATSPENELSVLLRVASPKVVARNTGPGDWVRSFLIPDYMDALERVAVHYQTPPDEVALMKRMAAADPEAARDCFQSVARIEGLL